MLHPNPRPIHIWLPALADSTGGIQTYLQAFLTAYVAVLPGVSTRVFIKNDRPGPAPVKGGRLSFHSFGSWLSGPMRTAVFTARLLWSALYERPALIIVGHANFSPLAAWLQKTFRIPFLVIVHGVEVWGENGRRLASSLSAARSLFSVSRFTRDELVNENGLDRKKILLLPNTVDAVRFSPGPPPVHLREKLGIPAAARIILTICRLSRTEAYKGYDQILRALSTVRQSAPTAHYILGGRGDDMPRIRQLVAELGLEDAVTLAGFVPETDLVDFYRLCDVFAMPSRKEGFGIVFLEALACGRPVLAGNRDGSVDALLDGELGVLVDPEDTSGIARALADLLAGRHAHPLVYQPQELHCRVIAAYGPARFTATLAEILPEVLPAAVRSV